MAASPPEQVDWIDEDGTTLASLPRSEIRARNLLHRVTATFVFHPDGRLFVHQRSPRKDVYPALFDPCVGGTVVSGEDFTANACRELHEELGVAGVPLHALFGHRFGDGVSNSLIRVFACVSAGPFRFQPEEVVAGDWQDEAGLERLIAAGRVCPDSVRGWRRYLALHGPGRNFAREIAPGLPPIDCADWLAGH
jgi:isopentenyldiphosphate isomerase